MQKSKQLYEGCQINQDVISKSLFKREVEVEKEQGLALKNI